MRPLAEPHGRAGGGILQPAHCVHPGPGGVHHRPRGDRDGAPVGEHLGAGDPAPRDPELAHLGVVEHRRPGLGGRPDVREAEAAVVRVGVGVEPAGAQAVEAQARHALASELRWDEPAQAGARERGVEDEARLDRQRAVRSAPVERKQEGQAADEVGRDHLHQQPPLVVGLSHQADVAQPEVAEAAVDQLRRGARGPRAEVPAVDKRDGEPGARRLGRDARADDAPSDHEQVECPPPELLPGRLAIP